MTSVHPQDHAVRYIVPPPQPFKNYRWRETKDLGLGVLIPHCMLFPLFEAGSLLCTWPQLLPIPDAKSLPPHLLQGDIAAWVLFIWLVLMVDST